MTNRSAEAAAYQERLNAEATERSARNEGVRRILAERQANARAGYAKLGALLVPVAVVVVLFLVMR